MTRLAILESDPRICGPNAWSQHVKAGAQRLGYEVELVSPTKSGKQSTRVGRTESVPLNTGWSPFQPDATPRWSEAGEYLSTFDLIILPEPKSAHLDKEDGEPVYVGWLRQSRKPFVTALHGPQYDPKKWASKVECTLSLPNFVPALITSQLSFADTNPALQDPRLKYVVHALPYEPTFAVDDAPPAQMAARSDWSAAVVGFTGRMMPNLGAHLLAIAAEQLRSKRVELWGSASLGMGANPTYTLWKWMLEHGWEGVRSTTKTLRCTGCRKDWTGVPITSIDGITCDECGYHLTAPLYPYPWWVHKDGRYVIHAGGFISATETCRRFAVHVDLTGRKYTYGLEKFTSLEAIDAGCVPVLPKHLDVNGFVVSSVDMEDPISTTMIDRGKGDRQLSNVAAAVNIATEMAGSQKLVEDNRRRLREVNDPANFLKTWASIW